MPLESWRLSCAEVSEPVGNQKTFFRSQSEDVTLIGPPKTQLVFDEYPSFVASPLRQSAYQSDAVVPATRYWVTQPAEPVDRVTPFILDRPRVRLPHRMGAL